MFRIACFGGIYSNYPALEAAVADVRRRGVEEMFFLGDAGAFGPHPDRALSLLREHSVVCMQGNYDNAIAHQLPDCQCGYTDPRDNYFAQVSYDYTLRKTSAEHRDWMRTWPTEIRREYGDAGAKTRVLMCHGSPRRTNEFLWESTTPTHFLDYLADEYQADLILATHTGIKWQRELSRGRQFVNVGVLGRPENDGLTSVWYTLIEFDAVLQVEFVPISYDHHRLAREMAEEGLPEEFQQTILTGWWTSCLEVLPSKERRRGKY